MAMDVHVPSEHSTEAQSMTDATGDRLIAVLVVVVFAVTLSLLVVALRIWCRKTIKSLGWDDFAAVMTLICVTTYGAGILALIPLGLGDPSGTIPADKKVKFFKCAYIIVFFYRQGLFWAKMSFVLLYYRIVSMSYWRMTYIAAIIFLIIWDISAILIFFLECIPLAAMWDSTFKAKATCLPHQLEITYVCAGLSIFTDLVVAILPLPVIWKLNLRRSQKIGLSGVFLLGCFSIVLAIVRIRWIDMWSDTSWDIVRPQLWGLAEATSALICACIPTYKPLLVRLNVIKPRSPNRGSEPVVRHQRSDDEIALNADTTKVESECRDSHDNGSHTTVRSPSYGTNTYITAVQDPWGK